MNLENLIFLLIISAISILIGYRYGKKQAYSTDELRHNLKVQLRQIIFTRKTWTSQEIFDQVKFVTTGFSKINLFAGNSQRAKNKHRSKFTGDQPAH